MGILDRLLINTAAYRWVNHRNLYLLGLATVACGIGWSNALMSIGQFILLGNYVLELDFTKKASLFRRSKILWVLLLPFLFHLLGLLWTDDFNYAFKDIKIKLPLLLLPLIIGTSPRLIVKEWKTIFLIYCGTLFLLSLASLSKLLGFFNYNIIDKRELSIYISHIRYGLNFTLAIFLLYFFRAIFSVRITLLLSLMCAWFIACLFLFELYTGLIIFIFLTCLLLFYNLFTRFKLTYKIISLIGLASIIIVSFLFINDVKKDFYADVELDYDQDYLENSYTPGGEEYAHDYSNLKTENGVYVRRYMAIKELRREWNKRSSISYDNYDKKGQLIHSTINRYMSSKGLKKDSAHLWQLSDNEIRAIEDGVANIYYLNHNALQNRIHKTFYEWKEYRRSGNATGFSLLMRYEFWKTALKIIRKDPLIGVGTGDIKEAFIKQYEIDQSKLDKPFRKRAHNQYLTFFATFGIIGLALFIFFLFYPVFKNNHNRMVYFSFFLIMCLSFITEDTLETQAGVTLFAFFNSVLLLGVRNFQATTD